MQVKPEWDLACLVFHTALGPERLKVGLVRFRASAAPLHKAVKVATRNKPTPCLVLLQERPKFGKEEFRLWRDSVRFRACCRRGTGHVP